MSQLPLINDVLTINCECVAGVTFCNNCKENLEPEQQLKIKKMPYNEDEESKFVWSKEKELQLLVATMKKMPPWRSKNADEDVKRLFREFLDKYSGGKVVRMLKSVLNKDERLSLSNLIKEEDSPNCSPTLSQELIDDIDMNADGEDFDDSIATQTSLPINPDHIPDLDRSQSPSLLEGYVPVIPFGSEPRWSPIPHRRKSSGEIQIIPEADLFRIESSSGKENFARQTSTPISSKFRQRKRKGQGDHLGCLKKKCSNLSDITEANTTHDNGDDDSIIEVEPDCTFIEEPAEVDETRQNDAKPKVKKLRCGKSSLLHKLREVIGADDSIPDESVLDAFRFKETLYHAGVELKSCPCKMESNNVVKKLFTMTPKCGMMETVHVCHKCFNHFIHAEKNEATSNLLSMIHQFHHEGIMAIYIRTDGACKRLFELRGTKKWLKSLKTDGQYFLSDCANFKIQNGKVLVELMPSAKSATHLRKNIKNTGDKFKLFIKVSMNGKEEKLFSLYEAECLESKKATDFQTSILDFVSRSKSHTN